MDCKTAETMINKYINHQLSPEELRNFLEHIEKCSHCHDELETYFIVHEAIRTLDTDDRQINDFQWLLNQDIEESYSWLRHNMTTHLLIMLTSGAAFTGIVYMLCRFFNINLL